MGMFDYVHFEMPCPKCGATVRNFQTKDEACTLDMIEPDSLANFYASCKCGVWLEFTRPRPDPKQLRAKLLTREEVEAIGFVLDVLDA